MNNELEMTFDPNTIEDLGVRMYSTLPPVLAELIANSYDADAENIQLFLNDQGDNKEIIVEDDGFGMTFEEINTKFLRIGRKRRTEDNDQKTPKGRSVIGKKGLGKLSFFGIAHEIEIETKKDGKLNSFKMDWEKIKSTVNGQDYKPEIIERDKTCDQNEHGTKITLRKLQRESDFNPESIATSLSKIFIIDSEFKITISHNNGTPVEVDNDRKYADLDKQIEWSVQKDIGLESTYKNKDQITGHLIATKKPISPKTNMRGIVLFSRRKLVNQAEYFSDSTSSHFFSYLTGWLEVDFIDDLSEDVISTNRQSLKWDHPEMAELRTYLQELIRWLEKDWRKKRDEIRKETLEKEMESRGMSIKEWQSHVPEKLNNLINPILESLLEQSEFSDEEISGTVENLKELIPPYPYYHYQNLHPELSSEVFNEYKQENYYKAVAQGVIKYIREIQKKSSTKLTDLDLIKHVFIPDKDASGNRPAPELDVTKTYKRPNGTDFEQKTHKNIGLGHGFLAYAMWSAFRNPLSHELESDLRNSGLYTEQDCLDALGLLSHLFRRLDGATT
ncbi:ATP-binding protein [Candidatus Nomurabacteria bacterium]|nr:ATP-binding protein [Candidatus Nomurabacteria bacterium]